MIDYLVSFVQCLCLLGYLYGAWLVITHKSQAERQPHGDTAAPPSQSRPEEQLMWRRYTALDG